MTPATQETIPAAFELRQPTRVHVSDDRISWAGSHEPGDAWPGTEGMLTGFVELSRAQPEEMAAWLQRFGILRLCAHGHPEYACSHKRCPGMLDGGKTLSVRSIRDAARSFDAALRIASSLYERKPGDRADWIELQNFLGGGSTGRLFDPEDRDDYNIRRQQYADWLERCFERCGVGHEIRWGSWRGLQASPMARDLLGVLVILLYRESVGHESYRCDHCGNAIDRSRPPRPGESVYCKEADCQRVRARENQRRSREARR